MKINPEKWNQLLSIYREDDETPVSEAMRLTGLSRRTVVKALDKGYNKGEGLEGGRISIRRQLESDKAESRAEAEERVATIPPQIVEDPNSSSVDKLQRALGAATDGMISSMGDAGVAIKLARKSSIKLLIATHSLADSVNKIAKDINNITKKRSLDIDEAVKVLKAVSALDKTTKESLRILSDLEARYLGDVDALEALMANLQQSSEMTPERAALLISIAEKSRNSDSLTSKDTEILDAEFEEVDSDEDLDTSVWEECGEGDPDEFEGEEADSEEEG